MLDVSILDPQSGEVIRPVPPVFGASAEDEAFFESEAPPFAKCADPAYSAGIRTMESDKDDIIFSCIVRAGRNPDQKAGLAVAQQMVRYAREDPNVDLDKIMRMAMDEYGIPTDFVNLALTPEAADVAEKKSKLLWIIGGIAAASALTVGVIVYARKKG
jgi:hypothetical protein